MTSNISRLITNLAKTMKRSQFIIVELLDCHGHATMCIVYRLSKVFRVNRPILLVCIIIMLIASACGGEMPPTEVPTLPNTATPNEVIVTPDATRLSRDLPPTWTPTYTPTVTLTYTPSPTFTITPSLTPIDISILCDNFTYILPEDGEEFGKGDVVNLSYGISKIYSYARVGLILEHIETAEVITDFISGGTTVTANRAVTNFPISGRWDYLVGVFINNDVDIFCSQDGYFLIEEGSVRSEQPNIIPTALPVPSITPQPPIIIEGQCSAAC